MPLAGDLTVSERATGGDERAPAPASHIQARDRPDDSGGYIVLSWSLSPDDQLFFSSLVPGGYVPTSGQAIIFQRRGIGGYRIYRAREGDSPALLAEVAAGSERFVDDRVEDNMRYLYDVRAFDSRHETAPPIALGSDADRARRAQALDNLGRPLDVAGQPVLGWFDRGDDTVDFADFFLFADHFGRIEGEFDFDAQFDLNQDRRVDFADFFVFADHFGKVVANYRQIIGDGD